jgi:hypothetical protein
MQATAAIYNLEATKSTHYVASPTQRTGFEDPSLLRLADFTAPVLGTIGRTKHGRFFRAINIFLTIVAAVRDSASIVIADDRIAFSE